MRLHLPFYCAVCGRVVWPWVDYVTMYGPNNTFEKRVHLSCSNCIMIKCSDSKEFMKEWDKIMRSVKNEKE